MKEKIIIARMLARKWQFINVYRFFFSKLNAFKISEDKLRVNWRWEKLTFEE